jgi:hypothetical protein
MTHEHIYPLLSCGILAEFWVYYMNLSLDIYKYSRVSAGPRMYNERVSTSYSTFDS